MNEVSSTIRAEKASRNGRGTRAERLNKDVELRVCVSKTGNVNKHL